MGVCPSENAMKVPKMGKYYEGTFIILQQTGPLNFRVQKKPRGRMTHVDKLLLVRRYRYEEEVLPQRKSTKREEMQKYPRVALQKPESTFRMQGIRVCHLPLYVRVVRYVILLFSRLETSRRMA